MSGSGRWTISIGVILSMLAGGGCAADRTAPVEKPARAAAIAAAADVPDSSGAPSAPRAATARAARGAISELRMADAVALHRLERGDERPYLMDKLQLSRGGRIYFGQLETYDEDDQVRTSVPIIARHQLGRGGRNVWTGIRIDDPRLHQAAWAYVAAGPKRGEIWGVLDHGTDENQPDLLIVHSTDGGETFSVHALSKPRPAADFDSMAIGPDGKGRLTVYLSGEDASVDRPGYYHFRTSDGGRSWSKVPEYEPDALTPGHDVPDEEQPESSQGAIRRTVMHSGAWPPEKFRPGTACRPVADR